jgi:alginate O-acetyltransferase complex protein AlgJ
MRSRCDLLVVLGFFAALLAPALAWRLEPGAWSELQRENRRPAAFPGLPRSLAELQQFPAAAEAWHTDTFGLRSPLLRLHNLLALRFWHKLPSQKLLLGREDWIFYPAEDSRTVWRGLYPVPRDFVPNWTAALRSRAAWYARRGIAYLCVIAPNKETVYPDMLPRGEEALGPTLLERLGDELVLHPDLPLADLRAVLADERAHDRPEAGDYCYHPLGTHWTARAGWRAAQAIVQRLEQLYPELGRFEDFAREDCASVELPGSLDDTWAGSLHLEDIYRQRVYSFAARAAQAESCTPASEDLHTRECLFERAQGGIGRMLLLHDSFGPWLREPLAEHAQRLRTLWDEQSPIERIVGDAPSIVIELRSERRLLQPPLWLYDPLESLAPETYAALPELARLPAGPDSIGGIAPYAGSRIERAAGDSVRIVSDGSERVLLDGWEHAPAGRLALHLVLRAPAATAATIWYQTSAEPRFHPRRRNVLQLAAGTNELFLRLPESGIAGPLLFQPGGLPGEYVIERFEARSGQP